MARLKLASWNIGWFGQLLKGFTRTIPDQAEKVDTPEGKALQLLQKRQIAVEIRLIDPDILSIQEGPNTGAVGLLEDYCAQFLNGDYVVIKRPPSDPYFVRGVQAMFFLVRSTLVPRLSPMLLPVSRWQEATMAESLADTGFVGDHDKKWLIRHPWFKAEQPTRDQATPADLTTADAPLPPLDAKDHFHWRWPQVLVCQIDGRRADFVGLHLKSKFQDPEDYRRAAPLRFKPNPTGAERKLLDKVERLAIEARIKLTTEAVNIRYFVENRFRNEEAPIVFLLGDLNDGIGKEYFERLYLFHDLVSNLQGDVFFARRFLNHALFDYGIESDKNFRWTAQFKDAWDPTRAQEILLDHILFTQSVVGERFAAAPLHVPSRAGKVEHEAHNAANMPFGAEEEGTSDHRPVSVTMDMTD
jgi:hypothetical protein